MFNNHLLTIIKNLTSEKDKSQSKERPSFKFIEQDYRKDNFKSSTRKYIVNRMNKNK